MKIKNGIASLLFSIGTLAPSCSNSPNDLIYEPTPYSQQGQSINFGVEDNFDVNDNFLTKKTIDDLVSSSVIVRGTERRGSGVVLFDKEQDTYFILTCLHIINPEGPYILQIEDEEKIYGQAILSKINPEQDLALLTMIGTLPHYFRGRVAEELPLGAYGMGVGYPAPEKIMLVEGRVAVTPFPAESGTRLIEANINPGESGGGFFLFRRGVPHLGGLMEGYYNNHNFRQAGVLVNNHAIREFLRETSLIDDYL